MTEEVAQLQSVYSPCLKSWVPSPLLHRWVAVLPVRHCTVWSGRCRRIRSTGSSLAVWRITGQSGTHRPLSLKQTQKQINKKRKYGYSLKDWVVLLGDSFLLKDFPAYLEQAKQFWKDGTMAWQSLWGPTPIFCGHFAIHIIGWQCSPLWRNMVLPKVRLSVLIPLQLP